VDTSVVAIAGSNLKAQAVVLGSLERLRDCAQEFFTDVAFAHRREGRVRTEERVRASARSFAPAQDAAAALSGALEAVQAILLQLAKTAPNATRGFDSPTADAG